MDQNREIPDRTLSERLRSRFGPDVDPQIDLSERDPKPEPRPGGTQPRPQSSGVLSRLDLRRPTSSRYRLEGEIARGGMGAILEVWDEDLRRKLAMKVALPSGGQGSSAPTTDIDPRILSRFLEEAQVTGQLDHPGIVPVHELGLDDQGQVFFTMRLVRGRDLQEVFKLAREGIGDWSVTRVLGALLKACEAMSYAHAKGVIHRDLKPANVMVGEFGEVYVMDWGLARVKGHDDLHDVRPTARTDGVDPVRIDPRADVDGEASGELYTMDGDVLGTPAFMSPEQARGKLDDLDARTDVYAMGAMLYELLGGSAPYYAPGVGPGEILTQLLAGPPQPLESVAPDVPAELVAISQKAMSREPKDRYPDMRSLSEDLRAYLENRVVQAYETGAIAETKKWVRRNKPLAASLAAAVLALAGGLVGTLVLKGRADESAELARRQSRVADEVNRFLNDDLLASVAPEVQGIDVSVREILEAAAGRIGGQFEDEPEVEAQLRATLGMTFGSIGEVAQGLEHSRRALELFTELYGEDDERTVAAAKSVAWSLSKVGRPDAAIEEYERALDVVERRFGRDGELAFPLLNDLAIVHSEKAEFARAFELYAEAQAIGERVFGPEHADMLTLKSNLSMLHERAGRLQEAERLQREALEGRESLLGERHPETLVARGNLALILQGRGKLDESLALLEEVLAANREVFGPDHYTTAISLGNLGNHYGLVGLFEEAIPSFEESLRILAEKLGPDHVETFNARSNVIYAYYMSGRKEEAFELRGELYDDLLRVLGRTHPLALRTANSHASHLQALRRFEEAVEIYEDTIDAQVDVLGSDHPTTLVTIENLGGTYFQMGDYETSYELTNEVLEGRKRALGEDHPDVGKTTLNLAFVADAMGDRDAARKGFEGALAIFAENVSDAHPGALNCMASLAKMHEEDGRFDEAARYYRRAAAGHVELYGEEGAAILYLHNAASALGRAGEPDLAADVTLEGLAIARRLPHDAAALPTSLRVATRTLTAARRFEEAEALALELHELDPGPESRGLLAELYAAWGRPDAAAEWR